MRLKEKGKKIFFSCIWSSIISFCYVGGKMLDLNDSIDFYDKTFYLKWLVAFVPTTILVYGIFFLLNLLKEKKIFIEKQSDKIEKGKLLLFIGGIIFLLICWIPTWLSLYPGAFAYDAYDEWQQIKNNVITEHHPVLHVLLVGGLLEGMYGLTGNYNVGIAVYCFLQMVLLASALSYSVCFLKELRLNKYIQYGTLIFYGISPVCSLFSICVTKDVLFTAAELVFFIYIFRLITKPKEFFDKKAWQVGFVITTLGTMILRNNGLYVALIMLIIVGVVVKTYWKKYLLLLVCIFLPYMMYVGPMYKALDVKESGVQEMLSVPLQQMARVYYHDKENMSSEDIELLSHYVSEENLMNYNSTLSDPVKTHFNGAYFSEHTVEFFKLWFRIGMDNPLTYINSFLTNTVDFWYPNAIIDGYKEVYGKSSYFDYRVAPPGEERIYLESLHEFYERISFNKEEQTKPLVFLMLSPGWYFICAFVLVGYFIYHKKYKVVISTLVFVLTFLTVLLGPVALVRYVLIFFMGIPQLIALSLVETEEKAT